MRAISLNLMLAKIIHFTIATCMESAPLGGWAFVTILVCMLVMCTCVHAVMWLSQVNIYEHGMYICIFRWLKQEYQITFPFDKQPPVHMPIAYGLVDIQKAKTSEKTRPHSQVASLSRNVHETGADVASTGLHGKNSHGDTSEDHQCSLCFTNNEVSFCVQ